MLPTYRTSEIALMAKQFDERPAAYSWLCILVQSEYLQMLGSHPASNAEILELVLD